MAHPYSNDREHPASHRRVNHILKGEPAGAKQHAKGNPFSKVTSKSAAEAHDKVAGNKSPKRYARGGKVKHGHQTNIAIVVPHRPASPPGAGQPTGPAGLPPPPMAGPGPSMGAPPGLPPGMPMRASGGKVDGESTKADISKFAKRAKDNSYFRGGAATGVGREEKAARARRK